MPERSVDKALDIIRNKPKATQQQIEKVFDALPGVSLDFMLGEWTGGYLNTEHVINQLLTTVGWVGKSFWSVDDVDPIMRHDDSGKRVWDESFGKARLREIKSRGVLSAAMIYDTFPVIDHFRRVTDDLVLGMMDSKLPEHGVNYVFYMERIKKS